MKRALLILTTTALSVATAATNLVSNTATVTNRCAAIVTYTMSNGVAHVQDPSGKLIGTAEERALKIAAEGQADIASAAADAAGTAMEEWREFTATTDVKVCYIDAGFSQDLPALATNLCGWVAGSFYDSENGEDHYYIWFNREMGAPPAMCARIVSERGTNWLDGTWKDWAVTNWIDKATGREFVMPTARDYVQDGLIAMWDGIENAGWGQHDPNATVWDDLVGNALCSLYNGSSKIDFRDKYVNFDGSLKLVFSGIEGLDGINYTIETVNSVENLCYLYRARTFYSLCPILRTTIFQPAIINIANYDYIRNVGGLHSFSEAYDGIDLKTFVDGVIRQVDGPFGGKITVGSEIHFGFNTSDMSLFYIGKLYSFRIYSRHLEPEKIAANYAVDAQRFGLAPLDHFAVPCRELIVHRRNANCVLKTGTVITLGGRDGFDADIHKVNIEVGGIPTPTTSAQLPLFHTVIYSGTNRVVRAYTNGFVNIENGFVKEPANE